uniref:Retrovirus-related Pol polyprotein from transposon TNT 1-94 n=1 Tax=Panagrellus redivivus TaxID=6233 RepID=A0A7E4WBC3_PANRE
MQDTKNDKGEVGYRLRARSKKVEACAVVEKLCTGCAVSIVMRPLNALEKLNLLASDDTNEVLDSSPLGTNKFIKNELRNVHPKDMFHYGKLTLEFLADYLTLRYGFNGAAECIKTVIMMWRCMRNVY